MSDNERKVGRHPLHQETIRLGSGRSGQSRGTHSGGSGQSGRSGGQESGRS
ncbi:hypothetical protein AB0L00_40100 [Actinoallomurus sp. NPDC052308]|uniref:hypothetical protein n=1 Tax=Actinoallomurus sp. NPDC052308 TaxID=3155530 RepID=UPI00344A8771